MPGDTNALKISVSHWENGGLLDMDLDVSYDGGQTWLYGGGCKGAVSDPSGIEFHLTYQQNPTHVKGRFSSEKEVLANLTVTAGL